MYDAQDSLVHHLTSFESLDDLAIATGLLVVAAFVLPRAERRHLRLPTVLLVAYLGIILGHHWLVGPIAARSTAAILSLLLFLVASTRILFLVIVDWLLVRWLKHQVSKIIRDILQGILFLAMTLVLFRAMGVDLGSLLTTSAILTAVIGLSLQESVGNIVAGLSVRAERPFEVGDMVEFGDGSKTIGRVIEMNWRATKVRTAEHSDVVVPNATIAKSTIRNLDRPEPITRRLVDFQGPYDVAPHRIASLVLPALRGTPNVRPSPAPRVWLSSFGDSGIGYQVVYFLDDFAARFDVDSDIRHRIWYALSRARVSMPFPVREVNVRQVTDSAARTQPGLGLPARMALVAGTELFAAVPERECRALAEAAEELAFAAGEGLVFEGDPGSDLFIVARGEAMVLTHGVDCATLELARIGVGRVFGELSLLTGVRGATVRAVEETSVLRIGHDDFRQIVSRVEGLGEALLSKIVERQARYSRPEELGLDPSAPNQDVRTALVDRIRRFFS